MRGRRVASVMAKDLRTARRDSITTYLLISPLLMALAMRLVLPLIEGSPYSFAVDAALAPDVVAALERQGQVIALPDRAAVVARVERIDDVTGVVAGAARPEVILEGNEAEAARRVPAVVLAAHAEGRALPPPRPVHGDRPVGTILAALLAFSTILLAGLASGFSILEEKEHGLSAVYATSPLTFTEYAAAKLLASSALGLALAVPATALVLDGRVPFGPFAAALLAALPSGVLLGLIVGAFAKNQLQAIALLKALFFVFTSVPVIGFAVAGTGWAWAVAPFGNHWATQALFVALHEGRLTGTDALLALGLSVPLVAAALWQMRARLGLGDQK
ncbi:MAG TPA: ABC transporter permease [Sandaracinaceae bacterium LLY-WYZ-13_1]|nr:ABC transporter permease [Sandaracinaceae bacterium LLY-WYZ-13_1]